MKSLWSGIEFAFGEPWGICMTERRSTVPFWNRFYHLLWQSAHKDQSGKIFFCIQQIPLIWDPLRDHATSKSVVWCFIGSMEIGQEPPKWQGLPPSSSSDGNSFLSSRARTKKTSLHCLRHPPNHLWCRAPVTGWHWAIFEGCIAIPTAECLQFPHIRCLFMSFQRKLLKFFPHNDKKPPDQSKQLEPNEIPRSRWFDDAQFSTSSFTTTTPPATHHFFYHSCCFKNLLNPWDLSEANLSERHVPRAEPSWLAAVLSPQSHGTPRLAPHTTHGAQASHSEGCFLCQRMQVCLKKGCGLH